MHSLVRAAGGVGFLLLAASVSTAATPKEIDEAIKRGTDALRAMYSQNGPGGTAGRIGLAGNGIGPTCLGGLAMLEGGVPASDPAVKTVTEAIRNAAYSQTKTYQASLCLLYLDRYGEPADVPLIQILAVRLLVGQSTTGGWSYDSGGGGGAGNDDAFLRAIKPEKQSGPPRLHPDVEKYYQTISARRGQHMGDDNSNTQFAVIALWLSRKHGVPVDGALDAVMRRFMSSQNPRSGNWSYNGPSNSGAGVSVGIDGTPAMYCAGLIGLATGVARREEQRAKIHAPKVEEPKPEAKLEPKKHGDDPFFNPPAKPAPPPKKPVKPPKDALDLCVDAALMGLGAVLADSARTGGGALVLKESGAHGVHDLYFYWSLERTCVIYGVETLGGVKWYDAGAHSLVITQNQNGTWGGGAAGGFGPEVNTSFAVLFLCKSNLARDLSGKVQNNNSTEMRTGPRGEGSGTKPGLPTAGGSNPSVSPGEVAPALPEVTGNEAVAMASKLLRASEKDWTVQIKKLRDTRGGTYTEALVTATTRLEGDRLKEARQVLAERLARMTAETLRTMAKSEEPELRRGAVLAMAMKDDKAHIPDLIAAILDDEEIVVRAAKAGLKSLTGQEFGPAKNASIGEKKIAAEAWQGWYGKQKK